MGWRDRIQDEAPAPTKSTWKDRVQDEYKPDLSELMNYEDPSKKDYPGTVRGAIKALPLAGTVAGGAFGTVAGGPLGPLSGPVGAGLGGAAGKSVENILDHYLYGDEKSYNDILVDPAKEALNSSTMEMLGPVTGELGNLGVKGLKNVSSSMSKIPKRAMEVYAERGPEVAKISAKSENDLAEGADQIRQDIQKSVGSFKSQQNANISNSLDANGRQVVDMSGTINALEENKAKLNPIINADKIGKIQNQIDLIKRVGMDTKDGKFIMLARDAYDVQKHLQDQAEYLAPGQLFKKKDFVDITFQRAASRARQAVGSAAPEISAANAELGKVRRMEGNINKNLIAPDKPYAGLISAGTGENQINRRNLQRIGDAVGADFVPEAENLAAAHHFNDAGFLPKVQNGASMAPLIAGTGGIGELVRGDVRTGLSSLALGAMGSPIAIKSAIDTARVAKQVAPIGVGNAMQSIPQFLQHSLGQEPEIEGYKMGDTIKLDLATDAQNFENEIKNDPKLPPTQKAKRLNLLRKHGRIYIGN
ncbi:MAG TPA: hypothetical protein VIG33_14875 [Pseudobdellovibrionaceae bacterium]|jgi:hypothetical protein